MPRFRWLPWCMALAGACSSGAGLLVDTSDGGTGGLADGAGDGGGTGGTGGGRASGTRADAGGDGGPSRSDLRCRWDDANPTDADYHAVGPFTVGRLELTFEDRSRPIEETPDHAAAPSRVFATRIYYPGTPPFPLAPVPLAGGGPFPVIMYSHGYSSSRDESNRLGNHAASHGYIVVAPDYPLTNIGANGGNPDVNDVANQPADVSFLIDELIALSADPAHLLAGAVDASRIGAAGVSLGGLTTLLVGYHAERYDPRVSAIAPIAAPSFFFTERYYDTRDLPLLLLHGDNDAFIDYEANARVALERAAPSARLLTVAAGSHTGFGAPVDGALLGLVAPLYAPPDAHPDNPDGLGCGYVAMGLADAGPTFLEGLGGPEVGIEASDADAEAALPCTGDEYTRPAINLDQQMSILAASVVAFFDAHFAPTVERRGGACRFLVETLPRDPAVTIE